MKDNNIYTKSRYVEYNLSYKSIIITSYFVFSIIGSILHFAYESFNKSFFVGLFTPTNESVFEHLKLVLTPNIFFAIFFYFFTKRKFKDIFFITFLATCISYISIVFINYIGNLILSEHSVIYSIANYFISMFLGYMFIMYAVRSPLFNDKYSNTMVLGIILLLILLIFSAYFTIHPLENPLFFDYSNSTSKL